MIGMPHPKWDERPLLIVELVPGADADPQQILQSVRDQLPKLSWPDDIQIVDEIPLGATGKVLKTKLREMFKDYVLPELREGGGTSMSASASATDIDAEKKKSGFPFLRRKGK